MSDLRVKSLHGLFWTFGQQFGIQFINFFVSVILARMLLPSEFGLIGIITIFLAIGRSIVDSGMTSSLIRTDNPDQLDYSTVFYAQLASGVLIYLLAFASAPLIAAYFGQEILIDLIRVYCISFIIGGFSAVQSTKLNKEMQFKRMMLINIPALIGASIIGISMAYLGYGVWSLVGLNLSQVFFISAQLWFRSGWSPSFSFNKARLNRHLGFGYKLTLSGLLSTIISNIQKIVIAKMFSPAQLGFYTRAKSMQELPVSNISSALNKVTYPLFASIRQDKEKLKGIFSKLIRVVFFGITPVMVVFIVIAEPLFRFLLTEKWLPAVPYFQILCLAGIFMPMNAYNLNILLVHGKSGEYLKLEMIKNALIVLSVTLVFPFGIFGLLWGMVGTTLITFLLNASFCGRQIGLNLSNQFKDMLPAISLSSLAGASAYFLDNSLSRSGASDILRIILASALPFLFYLILARLLKVRAMADIISLMQKTT